MWFVYWNLIRLYKHRIQHLFKISYSNIRLIKWYTNGHRHRIECVLDRYR